MLCYCWPSRVARFGVVHLAILWQCNSRSEITSDLAVTSVHAGIDNGARLRVKGEGNAGRRGAPPGDLIVFIRVKEHPELRREGIDIHSDIEISYVDAILGSQVKVTTVDGPVELKIPPGTQPGTTLLMAKRGVPRLGASNQVRGNHNVSVPNQGKLTAGLMPNGWRASSLHASLSCLCCIALQCSAVGRCILMKLLVMCSW